MAQSRVRRRRSSQAVCDSLFCTVAVVAPVAFSLAYYRNDLRQLLRALFLIGILFGALLTLRHALRRARLRLREWLKTKEEEVVVPRPDLDQAREDMVDRVQRQHNERAREYESRVAGPRRERKMEERERRMRDIRGFRGQGDIVGGGTTEGAHSTGVSRLIQDDDQSQPVTGSHDNHVSECGRSRDQTPESCDHHMTNDDDIISDGDQSGKLVWVAVRLPERTIRSQFYTSQTMKMVYKWVESQGVNTRCHVLTMPHPRQLLDDRGCTLEKCGITMDTRLVLEEADHDD